VQFDFVVYFIATYPPKGGYVATTKYLIIRGFGILWVR